MFLSMHRQKNQLTESEFNKKDFFKYTRYKEGKGWVTAEAKETYNEMERILNEKTAAGLPVDVEEVYNDVRGTKSGYVQGLGYGPKPTSSSSNSKTKLLEEALHQSQQAFTQSQQALTQSHEALA